MWPSTRWETIVEITCTAVNHEPWKKMGKIVGQEAPFKLMKEIWALRVRHRLSDV